MSSVKETLTAWGKRLQQASVALDGLDARVQQRRASARQDWRHIPVFANMEFPVAPVTQRRTLLLEQNWLNGGEDVYFQGAMASVWAAGTNEIINFVKTDGGFAMRSFEEGSNLIKYVDFGWNIRVGRTGQQLLSPANGGLLMGSTTIRKDRAGKVQWFSSPCVVPAGENIILQLRVLRAPFLASDAVDLSQIKIAVALYGTRTGALHDR